MSFVCKCCNLYDSYGNGVNEGNKTREFPTHDVTTCPASLSACWSLVYKCALEFMAHLFPAKTDSQESKHSTAMARPTAALRNLFKPGGRGRIGAVQIRCTQEPFFCNLRCLLDRLQVPRSIDFQTGQPPARSFEDKAKRIQTKAWRIINGQQNMSSVLNSTNDDSVVINSVGNVVIDKRNGTWKFFPGLFQLDLQTEFEVDENKRLLSVHREGYHLLCRVF
ncbi:hypothetical protein TNIN_124771 [Trichonephila inaurata madagascariensis]|uniref:Uncharacterized protein n=1 Tax=Trichonephila inaurata madagascariensis TaxID=2747483 RepID=A0A8X6WSD1_9ARAC|nr:hypothetical protein TNIN_124771 [Trichonephila inaurata madagascariensis]